jgi:hypothetical protein
MKPFNPIRAVIDEQSYVADRPPGAKLLLTEGIRAGHYVPVSFVAKDWNVTSRRIRFLLASGRLLGRLQDNGYWEVRFPYCFTFGTRGPSLKRQNKPKRARPKLEIVGTEHGTIQKTTLQEVRKS